MTRLDWVDHTAHATGAVGRRRGVGGGHYSPEYLTVEAFIFDNGTYLLPSSSLHQYL
jgi:hypothetical protein